MFRIRTGSKGEKGAGEGGRESERERERERMSLQALVVDESAIIFQRRQFRINLVSTRFIIVLMFSVLSVRSSPQNLVIVGGA